MGRLSVGDVALEDVEVVAKLLLDGFELFGLVRVPHSRDDAVTGLEELAGVSETERAGGSSDEVGRGHVYLRVSSREKKEASERERDQVDDQLSEPGSGIAQLGQLI